MTRAFRCLAVLRDDRGASVVEFAFVLPAFLMFLFLILDGGRMLFTKQALNELAEASARCAAVDQLHCPTATAPYDTMKAWVVNRGRTRSRLALTSSMVTITPSATCFSQAGMAQVTIAMPYKSTALGLLPHAIAPSTLTSTSCFPVSVSGA